MNVILRTCRVTSDHRVCHKCGHIISWARYTSVQRTRLDGGCEEIASLCDKHRPPTRDDLEEDFDLEIDRVIDKRLPKKEIAKRIKAILDICPPANVNWTGIADDLVSGGWEATDSYVKDITKSLALGAYLAVNPERGTR